MGVAVLVFAVELQKVRTKYIFLDSWERTGASFKIECMRKGEESIKKSVLTEFTSRYYILGHNVIKKAFKWKSKWISTNIHYRGSPWGSRTQQHAYCLRYAHSHHIESHLGKKQPQAKIAIAFLFGQLHFNNVTSHALFYGGHLVMRSAKPGNHLNNSSSSSFRCGAADHKFPPLIAVLSQLQQLIVI